MWSLHSFMTVLIAVVTLVAVPACTENPVPRQRVMDFFAAMRQDTTSSEYLSQFLDTDELLRESSVYEYDTTISRAANRQKLLSQFIGDGKIRERWLRNQIVIGAVDILGDTATVEVSFIDRSTVPVKQYYNKIGLHLADGDWKVFAFKLF
jgi:hypothetical protein